MIRKLFVIALLTVAGGAAAHAQAVPAAIRGGNIEAGGFVGLWSPDYGPNADSFKMVSFGAVGDMNARQWLGIEAQTSFAVVNGFDSEKDFNFGIGPRVFYARGRWIPYAKLLVGYNHFTFPAAITGESGGNFAYMFGGGVDWRWKRHLTARLDYTYTDAPGFGNADDVHRRAGSLTPQQISVGLKYRW